MDVGTCACSYIARVMIVRVWKVLGVQIGRDVWCVGS